MTRIAQENNGKALLHPPPFLCLHSCTDIVPISRRCIEEGCLED